MNMAALLAATVIASSIAAIFLIALTPPSDVLVYNYTASQGIRKFNFIDKIRHPLLKIASN